MTLNCFKRGVINFASFFYPVKIYGKENLPKGSAVVVCNHYSFIDPLYLAKLNKKEDFSIIAKKELFGNRVIASILKGYGGVPIDRDNPDLKTLLSVIKNLKSGKKVLLFPEGTRNKTGSRDLQPIKGGSIIFAVRAKCPIVPVMIYKKARLFCKNKMIVGEPFELSNFYDKKNTDKDYELMAKTVYDKMASLQSELFKKLDKKEK